MKRTFRFFVVVVIGVAVGWFAEASLAHAQNKTAAAGADMWTGEMARLNLFKPHRDRCDIATEAFVQVLPNGKGFCIERDQRPADEWKHARHTCLQEKKRLPELAEFQFACEDAAALGLNDMTGDDEWSSNFFVSSGLNPNIMDVPTAGHNSGDCNSARARNISASGLGVPNPAFSFRCVR